MYFLKFHDSQDDAKAWADAHGVSRTEFNRLTGAVEALDAALHLSITTDKWKDDVYNNDNDRDNDNEY